MSIEQEALIERRVTERCSGLEERVKSLELELRNLTENRASDNVNLLVFSGDMDKLMTAFIIATGAAAMGKNVSMYFTFWGLTAVKKHSSLANKLFTEKMIALMLPGNASQVGVSKMHWMGAGTAFFKHVMKHKHIESLPGLIELAKEMGIRLVACRMAMDVMGIHESEMMDGLAYGGVTTYLGDALKSQLTLLV